MVSILNIYLSSLFWSFLLWIAVHMKRNNDLRIQLINHSCSLLKSRISIGISGENNFILVLILIELLDFFSNVYSDLFFGDFPINRSHVISAMSGIYNDVFFV